MLFKRVDPSEPLEDWDKEDGLKVSGEAGDADADSFIFGVFNTVASLRCRYCLDRVENLVSIVECWRRSLFPTHYPSSPN